MLIPLKCTLLIVYNHFLTQKSKRKKKVFIFTLSTKVMLVGRLILRAPAPEKAYCPIVRK